MKSLSYYLSPSFDTIDLLYEGIMSVSTNEKDKKEFTLKYNKVKQLAKGAPAPKFNYTNHGGGTSMEDLKDSYAYLDIQATWCGPCIGEIAYLKDLEEKYRKFNIHFVSISIAPIDDLSKWKNFVDKKNLRGIQLYADGDWKSSIITDYAIEGIPRFVLIDTDGNIVSADVMRSSNPKLITLLDEFIQSD